MAKVKDNFEKEKTVIYNVSDYIEWLNKLGNGDFLFRGHADEKWPLRSGAARRICGEGKTVHVNYKKVENYINELIEIVRGKELNKYNQNYELNCDLKILAELQHFGAATTLVDAHEKWPEFEHRKLPKNEHFGGRGVVMRPVAG